MELPLALEDRARVDEFQRKHQTRLLALLFTDMVGSTELERDLGDLPGAALIEEHHKTVRTILSSFPEGAEISTGGRSARLMARSGWRCSSVAGPSASRQA